ncbi:EF hand family protein [Nesidiocoris tenuis]|uniref:EF hand family protein n=1 Tax=Nesidiocoris tenuis TaxID=355587 RepID=A0ABN7AR46_9HEMI|nr:EF hand family protein [Nesidiocoris tenuis]
MGDQSKNMFIDVWKVISRIRDVLQRSPQLDIVGFLRKLDPLKELLMHEKDFLMVFCSVYRKYLGIPETEMRKVADFFRAPNGRILYEQFNQYLETDPPYDGAGEKLTTGLEFTDFSESANHFLSAIEMQRYDYIMTKIASRVINDDISLEAHLAEYELISKNTGHVSIPHLIKWLYAMNIHMDEADFGIIVKRLSRHHYTINYITFFKDVKERVDKFLTGELDIEKYLDDKRTTNISRYDNSRGYLPPKMAKFPDYIPWHNVTKPSAASVDLVTTISRIQRHCSDMGVRFKDWFQMFDQKLTGKMTPDNFTRAMSMVCVGTSGLSRLVLQPGEMDKIIQLYTDQTDPKYVQWKLFASDIEGAYVLPPNLEMRGLESFEAFDHNPWVVGDGSVPPSGNEWENTTAIQRQTFEEALEKIRFYKNIYRIDFATEFNRSKKCSSFNDGYVEVLTFYKVFSKIIPHLSPDEVEVLLIRYLDNRGFNCRQFLFEVLEDIDQFPSKWGVKGASSQLSAITKNVEMPREKTTLGEVFQKIRLKVYSERIELQQFMEQFDPLRTLYISHEQFERALASAGLTDIPPDQIAILLESFNRPFTTGCFEYARFMDALNSSLVPKHLETEPLVIPVRSVPIFDGRHNFLQLEERQELLRILYALSEKNDLIDLDSFKAFDKVKRGTLAREHFWQALCSMGPGIQNLLNETDVSILYKGLGKLVGPVVELDYVSLCWILRNLQKIYNGYPALRPPPSLGPTDTKTLAT